MTNTAENDLNHMRAALALGRRGLGTTWPNPSVGCVLVRDGRVIGQGYTAAGGRPHAEPTALFMARAAARGATAYVTLEPCCHWGRSPPCTDALIAAGIARVVVAAVDPDERVDQRGIARLRAAGIAVEQGLLEQEAREDLQGFFLRVTAHRPMLTLKLATTLDVKIATGGGESQWITGPEARRMAHVLRGRHDAVLAGVGTVLADDPELTCRLPGFRPTPVTRIVVDSFLRTPLTSKLVRTAGEAPVWFLTRSDADPARMAALRDRGATVLGVPADSASNGPVPTGPVATVSGGVDLVAGMKALAAAGLTRVLVEGGGQIAASLIQAGLIDRIAWFHAPGVMGGDGWPGVRGFGLEKLAMMPRFLRQRVTLLGADTLTELKRPF